MTAGVSHICTAGSWVDRLHQAGHLDCDQHDAAIRLQELFEASGIRPRLVGGCYDGAAAVDGSGYDGRLLETLNFNEMRAWRELGRLLAMVPCRCLAIVTAVVLWAWSPGTSVPCNAACRYSPAVWAV